MRAEIARAFEQGRFIAPRRPGMAYMLSGDRNYNPSSDRVSIFPPHVMVYAPNLTDENIGSTGDGGLPFIAYQGPHGYMITLATPEPDMPTHNESKQSSQAFAID